MEMALIEWEHKGNFQVPGAIPCLEVGGEFIAF